jgi:hypothetical protein
MRTMLPAPLLHPEDGDKIFLLNDDILPQHYTASQYRRHRLEFQDIILNGSISHRPVWLWNINKMKVDMRSLTL